MVKWFKDLAMSFRNAGKGIGRGLREERNMRIHLVAVIYVTLFGIMGGISRSGWAAVCLCFGTVISAELVNTALERLCDVVKPEYDRAIGAIKDLSAAAVLVCAVAAVAVAACIFSDAQVLMNIRQVLREAVWRPAAVIVSIPFAALFVFRKRG